MPTLSMYRGDTFKRKVQFLRDPNTFAVGTGSPVNLTGASAWFTIKNTLVDADPGIVQKTIVNGGVTIVDAASGWLQVMLEPIDTRAFPDGPVTLVYDVQVKEADGTISTIEKGTIVVQPDVTRAI